MNLCPPFIPTFISYIHLIRQSCLLLCKNRDRRGEKNALPRAPKSKVGRHLDAILKNNICPGAFLSPIQSPAALGFDRAGGEGKITVQSGGARKREPATFRKKKFGAGCITTPAGRNEIFYSRWMCVRSPLSPRRFE